MRIFEKFKSATLSCPVSENMTFFNGEWKAESLIGTGSASKVYKAAKTDGGNCFSAVKVISIPRSMPKRLLKRSENMSGEERGNFFSAFARHCKDQIDLECSLSGYANIVKSKCYEIVKSPEGWDIHVLMELLIGFEEYCGSEILQERRVLEMGIDICAALECCRKENIIHRDIKPDNIFVSPSGSFELGDFSIARRADVITPKKERAGSLPFMAPEVYRNEPYDGKIDIYSLGLVLYYCLNKNRLPFSPPYPIPVNTRNKKKSIARRCGGESLPKPCGASDETAEIILRACNYNTEERYQSPTVFRQALLEIMYYKS